MSESPFEKTTETPPAADDLARTQESSAAGGTLFDPEGASAAAARSALAGETALVPGAAPRVVTRAPSAVVPRTRRRGVIVAALGGGVAVVVGIALSLSSTPETAPAAGYDLAMRTEPVDARIELDGEFVSVGVVLRRLPRDGRHHTLRVSAAGHVTRTLSFVDRSPGDLVTLDPLPPVAPAIAPPARPGGGAEPMDQARGCMRSGLPQESINRCVVRALEGRASSETELRLLCVTYRSMGDRLNAVRNMRRYVTRYPATRYTDQFQDYINTQ
jgi:hypothetical protein